MELQHTHNTIIKIIILISLSLISFNAWSSPLNGSGELRLSDTAVKGFHEYITTKKGNPIHFVVTTNGRGYYYVFCPAYDCSTGLGWDTKSSIKKCENRYKSKCYIFARGAKIVWNNSKIRIKKTVLLSQLKVILTKNNFIDQVSFNKNNTNSINQENRKRIGDDSNADMIEQIRTLNRMHKSGVITDDEFKKAKSKILSK